MMTLLANITTRTALGALLAVLCLSTVHAEGTSRHTMPDSIELLNGQSIKGLIVKRTSKFVVIQTGQEELTVSNDRIRRIIDLPDDGVYFNRISRPGNLPQWRAIVQDLRLDDGVRSFQQIPATAVDIGNLRNVPYLSFRINGGSEMNIYGDPDNPAAIEFGIYGHGKRAMRRQEMVREFIAGHLNSQGEIHSLYSLDMTKGGTVRCGRLEFEATPPEAEDSYGGRWIVISNPERLEKARVDDATYARVTRPFDEVNTKNGRLRKRVGNEDGGWLDGVLKLFGTKQPDLRGFHRDKDGIFRVGTHTGDS